LKLLTVSPKKTVGGGMNDLPKGGATTPGHVQTGKQKGGLLALKIAKIVTEEGITKWKVII